MHVYWGDKAIYKARFVKKMELLHCFNTNLLKSALQFLVILLGLSLGDVFEIYAEGLKCAARK